MALFISRWFMRGKKKNSEINSDDEKLPPTVAPLEKAQNFCMTDMTSEGYNDATIDPKSMREGLVKIKEMGKLLCDGAIAEIKTEDKFLVADVQIKHFNELEQPIDAADVKKNKDKNELEISLIEEIKKKLEDNENLPVYITYQQGFKKGELAKIKSLSIKAGG